MKSFNLVVVFLAISVNAFTSANAMLIDFEDANTWLIPTGYKGFNWDTNTGKMSVVDGTNYGDQTSGYTTLANALAGDNVAFNELGYNPVDITSTDGGTFDFTSAWFASAWDNQLAMNFSGWRNGTQVYSLSKIATRSTAELITFNWLNIDTFRINDTGHQFAMDNMVVNKSDPVPEPATMFLFGTGIVGLVGTRLRRKKK